MFYSHRYFLKIYIIVYLSLANVLQLYVKDFRFKKVVRGSITDYDVTKLYYGRIIINVFRELSNCTKKRQCFFLTFRLILNTI